MTADQMMRNEIAKGPRPERSKLVLVGAALGVAVLVVGGIFGVRALNDYRADIASMQSSAADFYLAAEVQADLAGAAADRAQGFADDAGAAVTSLEAAEAEAAAQLAADQAAEAAKQAAHESSQSGPTKCPAGSTANSADGVNDTSCFPNVCFGISVPDPAHPECDVAFKP